MALAGANGLLRQTPGIPGGDDVVGRRGSEFLLFTGVQNVLRRLTERIFYFDAAHRTLFLLLLILTRPLRIRGRILELDARSRQNVLVAVVPTGGRRDSRRGQ